MPDDIFLFKANHSKALQLLPCKLTRLEPLHMSAVGENGTLYVDKDSCYELS